MSLSPPDPGAWAPYVGPTATVLAVFVSASVTVAIALGQLATTRSIARMRATLDLIEKAESSDHYARITAIFSETRRNDDFLSLIDPVDDDRATRFAVLGYLNHYETIALFIRKGVLDEPTYRDWIIGSLVRDWNAAADFVQRERWGWRPETRRWVYDPTLLNELQTLACRWSREAIRLDAAYSNPPEGPPGPEDEPLPTVATSSSPDEDLVDTGPTKSVDNPNR